MDIAGFLENLKQQPILEELSARLDISPVEIKEKINYLQSKCEGRAAGNTEKFFLYVDGAARNNPGPAGGGAVVYKGNEEKIAEASSYFGSRLTNNAAEYRALILGLELLPKECKELKIHMDSELVIKQLTGEYAVKSPNLNPYFEEVKSNLEKFKRVEFEAIPREKNKEADQLANRALDGKIEK